MNRLIFCDAHFHLVPSQRAADDSEHAAYRGVSCAHSPEEFRIQEQIIATGANHVRAAFGMHPQDPRTAYADFLESLLVQKRICAIGETGFDFYTPEYKSQEAVQEEAWRISLECAVRHQVPLIIHNRKALDKMFFYSHALRNVPAVLFHSFAYGPREAQALLNHGIPAYFSFSKQILNGNKKSIACVQSLPLERLLLETDAPYQTLKGESRTAPQEIERVYRAACAMRELALDFLCSALERNFTALFGS